MKRTFANRNSESYDVRGKVSALLRAINKPKKKIEKIGIIGMVPILFLVNQCIVRGTAIRAATTTKKIKTASSEKGMWEESQISIEMKIASVKENV